jgi:hypothetical protein
VELGGNVRLFALTLSTIDLLYSVAKPQRNPSVLCYGKKLLAPESEATAEASEVVRTCLSQSEDGERAVSARGLGTTSSESKNCRTAAQKPCRERLSGKCLALDGQ